MANDQILKKLFRRSRLASFFISRIPFIRLVAVNGSMALKNIKKTSDIDFFIIVEKKRLWTVRFLTILILDLLFLRAKGNNHKHKICINHFLTNKDYDLSPKNKFNANQYSNLMVLYQENEAYQKFINKNQWMNKYKSKIPASPAGGQNPNNKKIQNKKGFCKSFLEKVLSKTIGDKKEKILKKYQIKRIKKNKFFYQSGSLIKISDNEFYYYTDYLKKWSKTN